MIFGPYSLQSQEMKTYSLTSVKLLKAEKHVGSPIPEPIKGGGIW